MPFGEVDNWMGVNVPDYFPPQGSTLDLCVQGLIVYPILCPSPVVLKKFQISQINLLKLHLIRKTYQPVEKVRIHGVIDLEYLNLRKEKSRRRLCLIKLFRFYPAVNITPTMCTLQIYAAIGINKVEKEKISFFNYLLSGSYFADCPRCQQKPNKDLWDDNHGFKARIHNGQVGR